MKKHFIFFVLLIINFCYSYSQQTYRKLTSCLINDSLIMPEAVRHLYYTEEYGDDNAIIFEINDNTIHFFIKERDVDPDINFKELDIEFNEYKLDLKDSVLFIKGVINNIDNEKRIPFKNVLVFVCSNIAEVRQEYEYFLISSVAGFNTYEIIDSVPYYALANFQLDYARKVRYSNPGKQRFECKFDLTNNKTILVFSRYGYRLKAFDLTRQISCAIKPELISVSEEKKGKVL